VSDVNFVKLPTASGIVPVMEPPEINRAESIVSEPISAGMEPLNELRETFSFVSADREPIVLGSVPEVTCTRLRYVILSESPESHTMGVMNAPLLVRAQSLHGLEYGTPL